MANKRITELTDIGTPASSDVLEIVDVSDTTDSPEGTSKKVLVSALGGGGGGAVTSVNGQTGVVALGLTEILTESGTATDLGITLDGSATNFVIALDPTLGLINTYDFITGDTVEVQPNQIKISDGSEELYLIKDKLRRLKGSFQSDLTFTDPTANRTINFKNESGTVALLSDVTPPQDLESVLTEGKESTLGAGVQSLIIKGGDAYRDLVDDEMAITTFGTALTNRLVGFSWLDDSISFEKDYDGGGGTYKLLSSGGVTRTLPLTPDIKSASFTASNENDYVTNGTITVTDPTPVTNKGYTVFVVSGTTTINSVGYTANQLVYRFYNGTVWTSTLINSSGGVSDGDKGDITVSGAGTVWTIDNGVVTNAKVATGIDAVKLADGSVTNTELQYINSLTSNAQTQLDAKANKLDYIKLTSAYNLTSTTALQKLFNVGSGGGGAYNASANRTIRFMCEFDLTGLSTTSGNFSFGVLGTAGIASINYKAVSFKTANLDALNSPFLVSAQVATAIPLTTTTTQTNGKTFIQGTIVTSTAGTIILAVATGVATAGCNVEINSFAQFNDIGADTLTATSNIS